MVHLVLVQTAQALVGQQELRRGRERLGELQLLQGRRAQAVDRRPGVDGQAHQPERPFGGLEGLRARMLALSVETREHHVFEDRQPAKRPGNLKGAPDAQVDDSMRRQPGDLVALEANRAAVGDEGSR